MKQKPPRIGRLLLAAALISLFIKSFILDLAVVEGSSMLPALSSGNLVFVLRAAYGLRLPLGLKPVGYFFRWADPRPGDVVAAANPLSGKAVVKRVAAILPGDQAILLGDNPADSVDSREYGAVPIEAIAGKVVFWLGSAEAHENK